MPYIVWFSRLSLYFHNPLTFTRPPVSLMSFTLTFPPFPAEILRIQLWPFVKCHWQPTSTLPHAKMFVSYPCNPTKRSKIHFSYRSKAPPFTGYYQYRSLTRMLLRVTTFCFMDFIWMTMSTWMKQSNSITVKTDRITYFVTNPVVILWFISILLHITHVLMCMWRIWVNLIWKDFL